MKDLLKLLVRERVVLTMIVVNALAMFLHAFQQFPDDVRAVLYGIDYGCAVFFVVEMAVKVSMQGWSSFWASGWNRSDFIIVALSLPFLLSPTPLLNLESFSAVLLLRLGRVLRVLRLFHFIPNRTEIQHGLKRALQASVGVFFAIFVYTFTLTLFSYHIFNSYAPEHFGSPMLSLYSMFQIFTVEGWYEIPNQIAHNAGWPIAAFARAYFAFTVLTGGILGLSLANAVFVDEMVIDNTRPLEADVRSIQKQLDTYMAQSDAHRREIEGMIRDLHEQLATDPSDET